MAERRKHVRVERVEGVRARGRAYRPRGLSAGLNCRIVAEILKELRARSRAASCPASRLDGPAPTANLSDCSVKRKVGDQRAAQVPRESSPARRSRGTCPTQAARRGGVLRGVTDLRWGSLKSLFDHPRNVAYSRNVAPEVSAAGRADIVVRRSAQGGQGRDGTTFAISTNVIPRTRSPFSDRRPGRAVDPRPLPQSLRFGRCRGDCFPEFDTP